MKPTAIVLSLIVSLSVVFSAPTKIDARFKLPQQAGATSDGEFQTLIANLMGNLASLQGLAPSAGSNGGQGFGSPLLEWNTATGMPANGFPGQQGDVTLQPGAFHRPMPVIGNQQGGFVAASQPIKAIQPVRSGQLG